MCALRSRSGIVATMMADIPAEWALMRKEVNLFVRKENPRFTSDRPFDPAPESMSAGEKRSAACQAWYQEYKGFD